MLKNNATKEQFPSNTHKIKQGAMTNKKAKIQRGIYSQALVLSETRIFSSLPKFFETYFGIYIFGWLFDFLSVIFISPVIN